MHIQHIVCYILRVSMTIMWRSLAISYIIGTYDKPKNSYPWPITYFKCYHFLVLGNDFWVAISYIICNLSVAHVITMWIKSHNLLQCGSKTEHLAVKLMQWKDKLMQRMDRRYKVIKIEWCFQYSIDSLKHRNKEIS